MTPAPPPRNATSDGGQYASSYGLLLTFLLWLAIVSVQRMLSVLTNVLGHSELLRRASLASLLVVPAAVLLERRAIENLLGRKMVLL